MSAVRPESYIQESVYTDDEEVVNYNFEDNGSATSSYAPSTATGDDGHEAVSSTRSEVAVATSTANPSAPPAPLQRQQKKQYAVSTRWERQVAANGLPRDCNWYFCCCANRIGNMFVLWEKADGSPIVVAGPCWPFCIGVTLPLILGISGLASYFVFFSANTSVPMWVAFIYYPVLAVVLVCLFCVSCRDPGLMERVTDEEAGEGGWFWNEQVGSFRPPGALYCRECGVLIQDYDHLCPWTGTGVGGGNMLAFKAFVVGVNVICYFTIILVAVFLLQGMFS